MVDIDEEKNTVSSESPDQQEKTVIRLPEPLWNHGHVLLVLCIGVLCSVVPMIFKDSASSQLGLMLTSTLAQDAAFLLAPCYIVLKKYKQPAIMLGMFKAPIHKILILGIVGGLLCWLANNLTAGLVEKLFPGMISTTQASLNMFSLATNSFELVLLGILFVLIAPAAEEMIFRAFPYPPFVLRAGKGGAVVLTALVFAVMHFNIYTFLPLFIGGLGLGLLYSKFHNLWVNIVAHMSWNTLVFILQLSQM